MFKKILLAIAVALPLGAMAQKFGTVDLDAVFQAMPETAAAQQEVQEISKKYEDEYAKLQEEINKLYTDYQTIVNDPAQSDEFKQTRMQEIQEKAQKVDQFRNTAMQAVQQATEARMAPIQQKLMEAVKSVGVEGSYTFIFPNEPAMLLYVGTDVTDVTPLVRTKLGLQ